MSNTTQVHSGEETVKTMEPTIPLKLKQKFFNDPDWSHVENTIAGFIEPLRDVLTIDATKDSDSVRAEVLSRQIAYQKLDAFMQQAKITSKPLSENKGSFT